ncbi:P-loop containing nucleoside triphosphate hydrolase protein [Marasmius fiardii PR-910]|nr:P-loop containing nucleoside triphosphate hydrolase protein [Marasmius fiardii PR-910]
MNRDAIPTRVVMIGLGGATSSGKTTLAKHLRKCLHNSFVIHQDDFVPPAETLPVDPEYGFANWDDAPTAVDWNRMATFLSDLKNTGNLPTSHQSYDSFNETPAVPIDDEKIAQWKSRSEKFASTHLEKTGEKLVWVLIDGFLLYWDEVGYSFPPRFCDNLKLTTAQRIISNLDVRVFIRVPEDVARARREARAYHTPEGDVWRDPPEYWARVVWPAYVRAHKHMFEGDDVARGNLSGKVKKLILFESTEAKMEDMVDTVMEKVLN